MSDALLSSIIGGGTGIVTMVISLIVANKLLNHRVNSLERTVEKQSNSIENLTKEVATLTKEVAILTTKFEHHDTPRN